MISSKKSELIDSYPQIQIRKKKRIDNLEYPQKSQYGHRQDTSVSFFESEKHSLGTIRRRRNQKRNTWEDYRQTPG